MIVRKAIIYILAIIVAGSVMTGCSLKKRIEKADLKYNSGEYYAAAAKYKKLQSKIKGKQNKSLKADVSYKTGICYWKLGSYQKAGRAFQTAVRNKCEQDDAYLYLGKCMLATEKYKDAKTNFNYYLAIHPNSQEASEGLRSAEQIATLRKGYTRFTVEEFKQFNSKKGSTFCPMYAGSDDQLVMTSNRTDTKSKKKVVLSDITGVRDNDIFGTKRNKAGKWEPLAALEGMINTAEDEGVTTLTEDGRTMLFTYCASDREAAQIYSSQRSGAEWTEPTEVKLFDDSTITVGDPALSPDGNWLYFVSDDERGFGGKDIWRAEKVGEKWGIPENLGYEINTPADERFPYVMNDSTIYFSSNGHIGLGGLDLYVATRDTAGHWEVSNLLAPINSNGDDFGITFSSDRSEGFFSSNRNQRKQEDKIYHFYYPPLTYAIEGTVVDEKGEMIGDAIIKLVGNNGEIVKTKARKDGTFRIELKTEAAQYVMGASHKGYLNASHSFMTTKSDESKTYENKFVLVSLTKSVKMDNIFYEFGKWTLTPESEAGLKSLVKILTDNPNITIELSAHTDMVGSEQANQELSQKRAQSVVNYLIKAGIAADRLTAVGYGESRPVVVSEEQARQYRFLTEGDTLTPDFIESLTKEQQEICNTLNRRTEFKVLKTTYNLY